MKFTRGFRLALAALLLSAWPPTLRADVVGSPDRRFAVQVGSSVDVVDAEGQNEVRLVARVTGAQRVDVRWSPDSTRVVVAVDYPRGSGIFAAWNDGAAWHKTLEPDELPVARVARAAGVTGRLVAEQRGLGDWVSPVALTVNGELAFSGGQKVAYAYTLAFVATAGTPDRGGYEEGVLKGLSYRLVQGQ